MKNKYLLAHPLSLAGPTDHGSDQGVTLPQPRDGRGEEGLNYKESRL